MTVWNITLNDPWFDFVKTGEKCYEGRCNWKQASQYKVNDILVIKHHTNPHVKEFSVFIKNIYKFDTFETALKTMGLPKILPNVLTVENGVDIYLKYYKLETQINNGILMIELSNINHKIRN
jgi:ASC-1-like (ASCH) protein